MKKDQSFKKLLERSIEVGQNEIDANAGILSKYLDLLNDSEEKYMDNVEKIIDSSIYQLQVQNEFKIKTRLYFIKFFSTFLSVEFIGLLVILFFNKYFCITEPIILAYITSVFLETIGVIYLMVKFTFNSQQENQSLQILNNAIEKIQKL